MLTKSCNSRAPGAIGEWNGTVRIGTVDKNNGKETERDVPFRSTAVVRNGNVYFLMMPTVPRADPERNESEPVTYRNRTGP